MLLAIDDFLVPLHRPARRLLPAPTALLQYAAHEGKTEFSVAGVNHSDMTYNTAVSGMTADGGGTGRTIQLRK